MSVYQYLTCLRTGMCFPASPAQPTARSITPRQASFLFLRFPADLTVEEKHDLEKILTQSRELATIYPLVQRFQQMIHHQGTEHLTDWMESVLACSCSELHRFVSGLHQDFEAVKAALTSDWSNEWHASRRSLDRNMLVLPRF